MWLIPSLDIITPPLLHSTKNFWLEPWNQCSPIISRGKAEAVLHLTNPTNADKMEDAKALGKFDTFFSRVQEHYFQNRLVSTKETSWKRESRKPHNGTV